MTGFPCDWPPLCPHQFATQEDLDAHYAEHWEQEDALNDRLRTRPAVPDAVANNH